MAINIARGTSPRGLISLRSTSKLLRPLLSYTKEDILSYAQEKKLTWQEDSTNTDTRYTRNRLRSKLANSDKAGDFEKIYHRLSSVYKELDQLLAEQERAIIEGMIINRTRFLTLPFSVGCELLARFFGRIGVDNIDQQLIVNAAVAVRTYKQGKKFDLDRNYYLASEKKQVVVHRRTI
jgi:tRNA(Ile)-lysidine synthase TilS/MesJ